MAVVEKPHVAPELRHQLARQHDRLIVSLAAGEIEEDAADFRRMAREIDARDQIGPILALRQSRGLRIRGMLGEREDRGAADAGIRYCIGMYREEQIAPRGARPRHPILERDELVVLARQHDPVAPRRLQEARRQLGRRERDVFLIAAGDADGAGIDAAMAGIDHDHPAGLLAPRRRRGDRGRHDRHDHGGALEGAARGRQRSGHRRLDERRQRRRVHRRRHG